MQHFRARGIESLVLRNDDERLPAGMADPPQAIVISPGPSRPARAGTTMDVLERWHRQVPILGVCLGHQAMVEFFGGKIVTAPRPVHGWQSGIRHFGGELYAGIPDEFTVARYHSLVAERASLPDELVVESETVADQLIMGVRHRWLPLWGLQFHPESFLTGFGPQILDSFLGIAGLAGRLSDSGSYSL